MMKRCAWMAVALLGSCGSEDSMEMDAPLGLGDGGDMSENHAPDADGDSAETMVDEPVEIDVLDNDMDADDDDLEIIEVTEPDHGTADISGNDIVYTPDAGYVGTDTFSYTISDGRGGTDEADVTVEIVALPTLIITSPTDNEVITGPDIQVTFAVTGCTFAQPPSGECHAHRSLDGMGHVIGTGVGQYTVTPIDATGLAVGLHTYRLTLQVNSGSDGPWVPAVEDQVSFTIQ